MIKGKPLEIRDVITAGLDKEQKRCHITTVNAIPTSEVRVPTT